MADKSKEKMNALIVYWSATGNTEKAAKAATEALQAKGIDTKLVKVKDALDEELYDYDVVVVASPVYQWVPPEPFQDYVKKRMKIHSSRGDIRLKTPALPGKFGGVLVTYSGPHSGIDEAIPAGKWLRQFLRHIGFKVEMEEYVVGEFHGRLDASTQGVLGDIRGRPNEEDLQQVKEAANKLAEKVIRARRD